MRSDFERQPRLATPSERSLINEITEGKRQTLAECSRTLLSNRVVLERTSKFLNERASEQMDCDDPAFRVDLARQSVPEQRKVLLQEKVRVRLGHSDLVMTIGDELEKQIPLVPAMLVEVRR